MKKIVWACCFFVVCSCNWFASKEQRTQKLVEKELAGMDWNDVDRYPLFENCDELLSKTAQKECFEQTLLEHFSKTLSEFEFILDTTIRDTIKVDFLMEKDGGMHLLEITENAAITQQIPEFEAIIARSLKAMPPVSPPLKRGIPVSAKFRIPIIMNNQ